MDQHLPPDGFQDFSSPVDWIAEDIDFEPANTEILEDWIKAIISRENCQLGFLNFIFCSDAYLLGLNQEVLGHDTLTDIITFPYQIPPRIEGDVFISIERVRENAEDYSTGFEQELHRVIIHGVLHLCGHQDKTAEQQAMMRRKEDEALELLRVTP